MADDQLVFELDLEPTEVQEELTANEKFLLQLFRADVQGLLEQTAESLKVAQATLAFAKPTTKADFLAAGRYIQTSTGYEVKLRAGTGVPADSSGACLRNLRHQFLVVDSQTGGQIIVDFSFKAQFQVGHSNAFFNNLLEHIPDLYVGPRGHLLQLVRMLSREVQKLYNQQGVPVPPWRQPGSLLSLWKPTKYQDTEVWFPSSSMVETKTSGSLIEKDNVISGTSPTGVLDCDEFASRLSSAVGSPVRVVYGFSVAAAC